MAPERVFIVVGLGTFGSEVCRVLSDKGGKVIAVDRSPDRIERMKDIVTQAVLMDSTDEEALRSLPLDTVDVAVVAMASNQEASILTTALLKKLDLSSIIARAVTDIHAQVLRQVGATEVINIELDEGREIAERLISPDVLERIPLSKDQVLAEIRAPKSFVGKSLVALELRRRHNINVVSIKRTETAIDDMGNPVPQEEAFSPGPQEIVRAEDILVCIGDNEEIDALREA